MILRGWVRRLCLVMLAVPWIVPVRVSAQPDYDPETDAWNGLSTLRTTFQEQSVELHSREVLDLGTLSPSDALLILYPQRPLPAAYLASFLRSGGRIALVDDFGEGDGLLKLYRITSRPPSRTDAPVLRGNHHLPLARPRVHHALTEGVRALATNHPRTLSHPELEPLFSLDENRNAVVLAGAVGKGRFVAISDPSLFINNMLLLKDNVRFARNLARYLATPGGRVYLVTPTTEFRGDRETPTGTATFEDLRRSIQRFATAELPPFALTVLSAAFVLALVILATSMLPRRSPYDGSRMFAKPALAGGFAGRVEFFSRPRQNLLHPTLVYKFELEAELLRRMKRNHSVLLRDVAHSLERQGFKAAEIKRARSLLLTLDELREKQDHLKTPPKVSPHRFRQLIAEGEWLLRRIEETTPPS